MIEPEIEQTYEHQVRLWHAHRIVKRKTLRRASFFIAALLASEYFFENLTSTLDIERN